MPDRPRLAIVLRRPPTSYLGTIRSRSRTGLLAPTTSRPPAGRARATAPATSYGVGSPSSGQQPVQGPARRVVCRLPAVEPVRVVGRRRRPAARRRARPPRTAARSTPPGSAPTAPPRRRAASAVARGGSGSDARRPPLAPPRRRAGRRGGGGRYGSRRPRSGCRSSARPAAASAPARRAPAPAAPRRRPATTTVLGPCGDRVRDSVDRDVSRCQPGVRAARNPQTNGEADPTGRSAPTGRRAGR